MSWVYFVRYNSQIKIGKAANPAQRFYALKGSSPVPLEFIGVIPGDESVERALHARWASVRRSKRDEWFTATPDMLAFIAQNARPAPPARERCAPEDDGRRRENRNRYPNDQRGCPSAPTGGGYKSRGAEGGETGARYDRLNLPPRL